MTDDLLPRLNNWIYDLTRIAGIVTFQPRVNTESAWRMPHLVVGTSEDKPGALTLHEFGHFLAAEDTDATSLNFGLDRFPVWEQLVYEAKACIISSTLGNELRLPEVGYMAKSIAQQFVYAKFEKLWEFARGGHLSELEISQALKAEVLAWDIIHRKTHWGHKEFLVKHTRDKIKSLISP